MNYISIKSGQTTVMYSDTSATSFVASGDFVPLSVSLNSSGDFELTAPASAQSGVYSLRLTVTSTTTYTIDFMIYVVSIYSVEEHVFKHQQVRGFLNDESRVAEVNLSIFICEKSNNPTYKRYEYADEFGGALEAINVCPSVSFSNDERIEHLRASVELSPLFPIRLVFAKYFELQEQPFNASTETDSLFAFLRITNTDGDVIVDGIIDTQDGRFQYQFGNNTRKAQRVEKVAKNTQQFSYRVCESMTLETYAASTILSVVEMVDNISDKVLFNGVSGLSNGKGFIDFLNNQLPYTSSSFQRITKLFDCFALYITKESALAKAGIYRGEHQTLYEGIRQLCAVTSEPSTTYPHGIEQRFYDVIEMRFKTTAFIWSDTFGIGTQANGEKRSLNVERTRGLRNSDGFFPDKQKELPFSFLQFDTAQDLLVSLLETFQFAPSFQVRQVTDAVTGVSRYVVDALFVRRFHDGKAFRFDTTTNQFAFVSNNVLLIDKTAKTLNQIHDGEVDDERTIIRQLDQITPAIIRTQEVFGAGQEWNLETVNDGFFNRIENRINESNEVRAASSRLKRDEVKLLFSSVRRTKVHLQDYIFFIIEPFNRLISIDGRYPTFFAVNFRDRPRIRDYFAQAHNDYARLTTMDVRAERYENVKVVDVDTFSINAGTIIRTNLLHDSNDLVDFVIRQATIDHVGKSATLTLERVRAPLGQVANTDTSYNAAVVFDKALLASDALQASRFGVLPRKLYVLSPHSFNSPFLRDEMGDATRTIFPYKGTPINIFYNAYEGFDVKWSETLDLDVYRNDVIVQSYSGTNIDKFSDLLVPHIFAHEIPAQYQFVIKSPVNPNKIKHLRVDVTKGCLLIRNRRAYCKVTRIADGQPRLTETSPTLSHKYAIRVGFAYRGKVKVVGLADEPLRIMEIYANDEGIYITHIYNPESWKVELPSSRNTLIDLYILLQYDASATSPSFTLEVNLNGNVVTPVNSTKTYNDVKLDYDVHPFSDFEIGTTNDDKSYIAITYCKVIEYTQPAFNARRVLDLSFDNIFATNADEPFTDQLTQTVFYEDGYPNSPTPGFVVATTQSAFISIQPIEAALLKQTN